MMNSDPQLSSRSNPSRRRRRRHSTEFIAIDTGQCEACGACVSECPFQALGMISFLWHKHAKVADADKCRGCRRCIKVCPHDAIVPLASAGRAKTPSAGSDHMSTKVNNELYRTQAHAWWDDDVGEFSTIRFFVNPVRFGYFMRVLEKERGSTVSSPTLLDVGCGGGLLAEEFARAGFQVTGVDPAPETIDAAREHAAASGLNITYTCGRGESLPFPEASFDLVACCDVLEHVDDLPQVVSELCRVLKPNGMLLFDTINRTFLSKIAVIKVMQEWASTAFCEPNSHVWERFIKPEELTAMLHARGMTMRELRGIRASGNPISNWLDFRRRAKGQISFKELGNRLAFHEGNGLAVSYMGYAVKAGGAARSAS